MRSVVRQMKERSRRGLTERPRWAVDEARLRVTLLERKSEGARPRVVVEDESEWDAAGEETTRVMTGAPPRVIDGGRMVETEPPRERTDWEDWDACGSMGAERTEVGEGGTASL